MIKRYFLKVAGNSVKAGFLLIFIPGILIWLVLTGGSFSNAETMRWLLGICCLGIVSAVVHGYVRAYHIVHVDNFKETAERWDNTVTLLRVQPETIPAKGQLWGKAEVRNAGDRFWGKGEKDGIFPIFTPRIYGDGFHAETRIGRIDISLPLHMEVTLKPFRHRVTGLPGGFFLREVYEKIAKDGHTSISHYVARVVMQALEASPAVQDAFRKHRANHPFVLCKAVLEAFKKVDMPQPLENILAIEFWVQPDSLRSHGVKCDFKS